MTTDPNMKLCPLCWTSGGDNIVSQDCPICAGAGQMPRQIEDPPSKPDPNPWRDIKTDPPKASDGDKYGCLEIQHHQDHDVTLGCQVDMVNEGSRSWPRWRHTRAWMDAQKEAGEPETAEQYASKRCPSTSQVGGNHYAKLAIQPAEFITRNALGFLEGCVIKRMCRHGSKNGKEDLLKARHEIDLLIEYCYPEL